MDSNILWS